MDIRSFRYMITLFLSGAIYTILMGLASVWFLRSLGQILGSLAPALGLDTRTTETVVEIFDQLKAAEINLPLEYTGVACFLLCALAILILCGRKKQALSADGTPVPETKKTVRIVLVCVAGVLLFIPLTLITIWFSEVNDIRFDRVIQSLIPLLQAGVL